jgi:serine/threonine protein kinase
MNGRKRFGKYVLLTETGHCGLGVEYRAALLGSAGLERLVTLLRLHDPLAANADIVAALTQRVRGVIRMFHTDIVRTLTVGRVGGACYVAHELLEGRTLKDLLNRCRERNETLPARHALLIASTACAALEYAHSRSFEDGERVFHGLLTPANVMVTYDGDVRLRGFGYWNAHLRDAGALTEDELPYLAPEQRSSGRVTARADVYTVGSLVFDAVMGRTPWPDMTASDIDISSVELANVLRRSLDLDPERRYPEMAELRKTLDALLFAGEASAARHDFSQFLREIFRDDIERESRAIKAERTADYFEYLLDIQTSLSTAGRRVARPRRETPPPALPSIPVEAPAARVSTKPPEIILPRETPPTPVPPKTVTSGETPPESAKPQEAEIPIVVDSMPETTQFEMLPSAPEIMPAPPRTPTPLPSPAVGETPPEPATPEEAVILTNVDSSSETTRFEPLPPAPEFVPAPPALSVPPAGVTVSEATSKDVKPRTEEISHAPSVTQAEKITPATRERDDVKTTGAWPAEAPPVEKQRVIEVREAPVARPPSTEDRPRTADRVALGASMPRTVAERRPPIRPSKEGVMVFAAKSQAPKRPSAIVLILAAVVLLAGLISAVLVLQSRSKTPEAPTTTLSAEQIESGRRARELEEQERRVRELEEQKRELLRQMEEENATRAEPEARRNREPRARPTRPEPSR